MDRVIPNILIYQSGYDHAGGKKASIKYAASP
jgi:hypothetical protein